MTDRIRGLNKESSCCGFSVTKPKRTIPTHLGEFRAGHTDNH